MGADVGLIGGTLLHELGAGGQMLGVGLGPAVPFGDGVGGVDGDDHGQGSGEGKDQGCDQLVCRRLRDYLRADGVVLVLEGHGRVGAHQAGGKGDGADDPADDQGNQGLAGLAGQPGGHDQGHAQEDGSHQGNDAVGEARGPGGGVDQAGAREVAAEQELERLEVEHAGGHLACDDGKDGQRVTARRLGRRGDGHPFGSVGNLHAHISVATHDPSPSRGLPGALAPGSVIASSVAWGALGTPWGVWGAFGDACVTGVRYAEGRGALRMPTSANNERVTYLARFGRWGGPPFGRV